MLDEQAMDDLLPQRNHDKKKGDSGSDQKIGLILVNCCTQSLGREILVEFYNGPYSLNHF